MGSNRCVCLSVCLSGCVLDFACSHAENVCGHHNLVFRWIIK